MGIPHLFFDVKSTSYMQKSVIFDKGKCKKSVIFNRNKCKKV